jgi:hypothetical protein
VDVKDVEHETGDVYSSVRDIGSMGRRGRPPQSKRAKTVSKLSVAWNHFTRDENSFQDEPMTHCNYCGLVTSVTLKLMGPPSCFTMSVIAKHKNLKARQDKSQTKFTFL